MSDNSPLWELIYITVATLIVISFVAVYNEAQYMKLEKVTYPKLNEETEK